MNQYDEEVDEKLAKLLSQNLVLNAQASAGGSKRYVRESRNIPDLLADPIGKLMSERLKNFGPFKSVELGTASEDNEL
jgi:hypothetical protein